MSTSYKRTDGRVVRDFTDATVHGILSSLATPRALAVWLLYSSGEHDQLTQLVCEPHMYSDAARFRDDYLATSLLSKATFLRTSFNRKEKALEKFLKAEEQCKATNDRLFPYLSPLFPEPISRLHPLVSRVRSKIRVILGRFQAEELFERSDWGPGVSNQLKGAFSVKPNKYQQETGMTQEVLDVMWPLLEGAYPTWWHRVLKFREPVVEPGNVVTTVPKNSKTDRIIAVEPGFNLFFQKGIGSMIRSRLLRRGCNLNDQSINQDISSLAHKFGLATVDFSSASDTVAYETVRLLLPREWFNALETFRCKSGRLHGGQTLTWKKFSSMGNGYTFELESLIFYALALTVTEMRSSQGVGFVSVYGDDVILPADAYPDFLNLCEILGFTINQEKSFSSGYFYESCGSHWFSGIDVKPFYIKDRIKSASECYSVHNRILEYAHQCLHGIGLDARFKGICRLIRTFVGPSDFNLVPRHLEDTGFMSNLDHALTLKTTSYQRMVGLKIRISTEMARTCYFDGEGLTLYYLRSISTQRGQAQTPSYLLKSKRRKPVSDGNLVPLKSSTIRKTLFTIVPTGQWYNFGAWF